MEQYFAECTWCGWESDPADTQDAAGALGIDHAGAMHAGADTNAALAALRVRYYYTVPSPQPVKPEAEPQQPETEQEGS